MEQHLRGGEYLQDQGPGRLPSGLMQPSQEDGVEQGSGHASFTPRLARDEGSLLETG